MDSYRDDLVLYHYGILKQKWGVRRYQNPDGTLTAAGRKRYGRSQQDLEKGIRKSVRSATRASFRAAYKQKVADTRAIDAEREQLDKFHDELIRSRMDDADRNAIIESKRAATSARNDLQKVLLRSPAANTDRELLVDGLYEKVPNSYLGLSKSDYDRYVDLYDAHRNAYTEARTAITNYVDKTYKHKDVKRYVENRLTAKDVDDLIGNYAQYKIYSGESGSYLIPDEELRKKG